MNKEFIPYKQALELKELGFSEDCLAYYDIVDEYSTLFFIEYKKHDNVFSYQVLTPLYQQAFRWFREKYGLHAVIFPNTSGEAVWCIRWYVDGMQKDTPYIKGSHTYQEKELACLKKLIELVKQNKKS